MTVYIESDVSLTITLIQFDVCVDSWLAMNMHKHNPCMHAELLHFKVLKLKMSLDEIKMTQNAIFLR